jgi:tetratricopeptide (TPR) repeat protein
MDPTTSPTGFGVHKLRLKPGASREQRLERSKQMLARVLNLRTTVAFVGSGCSVPLGYPSWQKFTCDVVTHTLNSVADGATVKERLERFERQLSGDNKVGSDSLLFMLGVCQRAFQEKDEKKGKSEFRKFVAGRFKPLTTPPDVNNPYHALMALPIHRFVTSNYDCELERALAAKRQVPRSCLALDDPEGPCPPEALRSFTQQPKHFDQLALFVLARVEAAENMVFHCHGSYLEPDSMVITEADYQAWYFSERDDAGVGFRQNLQLLFGSNPILFVGFGLADDDLIRPLRMFAAEDLQRKSSRPLFALMPQKESATAAERKLNEDYFDQLYDRYGVHVIPYELADSKQAATSEKTLFHELTRWKSYRLEARDRWLKKPAIRQVDVNTRPPKPYHHYPFERHTTADFKAQRVQQLLEKMCAEMKDGARVIGLIGPGGTGKSWFAHELMRLDKARVPDLNGNFFWSSYYSNDSLTGLDRALAYLDPDQRHKGDRIERFIECLHDGGHLVVFDGIERFLQETHNPMIGKAFSPLADKLLEAMCSKESRSTVVITSRLWPRAFGDMDNKTPAVRYHPIQRFRSEDISDFEPFNWLEAQDLSALVSLLDGHVHALVLAAEMLRKVGPMNAAEKLEDIKQKLSGTPPDHRGDRMIRIAIESLDEQSEGLATKLLERMSVFMAPVGESTVSICFAEAVGDAKDLRTDQQKLVGMLAEGRLLHRTIAKPGESGSAFTVHPIVREYIFQQIHRAPIGSLPNFTLPGFTAATSAFHPGSKESVVLIKNLFSRLHENAEEKLAAEDYTAARALCRSAFTVIRSRMEALAAPRWCSYDDYLQILITLSHLALKVAREKMWSHAERRSIANVENKDGTLYAEELAWLYNELGLACYGEGAMLDTLAIWEQGLEINRAIDSREEGGTYLFQSLCNLGAAHIHYGHLDDAEKYLREAERINFRLHDKDHGGRILGYMALVKHLRGNLPQANEMYDKALKQLDAEKNWNPRAKSIFLRHKADLKIKFEDFDEAKECIEMSRGLAEEGNFPELAAAARMSLGHWFRSRRKYGEALREYNMALREAKRIGMRRLECEVISEFARLALDLGDSHIARQRAVESLRIANELVLGLKQTHDLVVLGRATIEARQHTLGVAYLKHAKRLADRQGYWLRSHEAEEQLHRFGESASDDEL